LILEIKTEFTLGNQTRTDI